MRIPQLYVNVGQTIFATTFATVVACYIFDYKGFRTDIKDLARSGYTTARTVRR